MIRLLVVLMATLASSVGLAAEPNSGVTTVSLRATVRLAPEQPLTLGAVASIHGGQCDSLAAMPLDSRPVEHGRWVVVEADAVRALIESSGARYGSVVVRGARANVTRTVAREASEPSSRPGSTEPEAGPETVRDRLTAWLHARFGAGAESVRVRFEDRDSSMLGTPVEGRVVEVRQVGASARLAVRVTVYERDSIVLSETLRAEVDIRVPAPVLVRPLRRGQRVNADDFETQHIWASPVDPPADPGRVLGAETRRSLEIGEVVRFGDLQTRAMVQRGQEVSVRTVRGSIVVTTKAVAKNDAGEGEIVELEATDRSGRRFSARVAGEGRAVMIDPTEVMP